MKVLGSPLLRDEELTGESLHHHLSGVTRRMIPALNA